MYSYQGIVALFVLALLAFAVLGATIRILEVITRRWVQALVVSGIALFVLPPLALAMTFYPPYVQASALQRAVMRQAFWRQVNHLVDGIVGYLSLTPADVWIVIAIMGGGAAVITYVVILLLGSSIQRPPRRLKRIV